jgi:hypothetical protein
MMFRFDSMFSSVSVLHPYALFSDSALRLFALFYVVLLHVWSLHV